MNRINETGIRNPVIEMLAFMRVQQINKRIKQIDLNDKAGVIKVQALKLEQFGITKYLKPTAETRKSITEDFEDAFNNGFIKL